MFSTVPMSRMTLAAPVDAMADIVRACSDLGCVHIEDYTQFEEGIGVGPVSYTHLTLPTIRSV